MKYRVSVHEHVPRGTWQYVMHHGMAYALSVDDAFTRLLLGLVTSARIFPAPIVAFRSWALFYFCLRYVWDGLGPPREAIQIDNLTAAMS